MIATKKNLLNIEEKDRGSVKQCCYWKWPPLATIPVSWEKVVFIQPKQHKYESKATLIWSNETKHTKMTFHSISLAPTPCSQVPDPDLTALTPGLPIHTMYSQRNFPGYNIQRTEDTETDRSCLHDMTTWWKNQETLRLMWEQDGHIREEWQGPEEGILSWKMREPTTWKTFQGVLWDDSRPLTGTCLCRAPLFLPVHGRKTFLRLRMISPLLFYLEIPRFPQSGQLRHRLYMWVS